MIKSNEKKQLPKKGNNSAASSYTPRMYAPFSLMKQVCHWGSRYKSLRDKSSKGRESRQVGSLVLCCCLCLQLPSCTLSNTGNHASWMKIMAPYWLASIQPQTGRQYTSRWHTPTTNNFRSKNINPKENSEFKNRSSLMRMILENLPLGIFIKLY